MHISSSASPHYQAASNKRKEGGGNSEANKLTVIAITIACDLVENSFKSLMENLIAVFLRVRLDKA